ncbi:MAG: acyl carrier protein [Bellilinea sp.]|nr:MAG: acyl carrier protein [Bellilinea sp.]
METSTILHNFILDELVKGRKKTIGDDDDLLAEGIIDSLGILQLVAFIEEKFNFTVPDEDVVIENFMSVNALSKYLDQKLATKH